MLELTGGSQGTQPEEWTLFSSSRWWPGVYFRLCTGWVGAGQGWIQQAEDWRPQSR